MRPWTKALAVVVVVWIVAGGVIMWSRAARPTAESVSGYLEKNPLAGLSVEQRSEVLTRAADQLNRLNFEERQKLRALRRDREFFEQLTPTERREFLERTLPEGFRQLMLALNKMGPEARKKIVNRVLEDLERDSPEVAGRIGEADAQKVIAEGLESFYEDASADVKLDFAPVIERLQRATQNLR